MMPSKVTVTLTFERNGHVREYKGTIDEAKALASSPYRSAAVEQAYLSAIEPMVDGYVQTHVLPELRKELGTEPQEQTR